MSIANRYICRFFFEPGASLHNTHRDVSARSPLPARAAKLARPFGMWHGSSPLSSSWDHHLTYMARRGLPTAFAYARRQGQRGTSRFARIPALLRVTAAPGARQSTAADPAGGRARRSVWVCVCSVCDCHRWFWAMAASSARPAPPCCVAALVGVEEMRERGWQCMRVRMCACVFCMRAAIIRRVSLHIDPEPTPSQQ